MSSDHSACTSFWQDVNLIGVSVVPSKGRQRWYRFSWTFENEQPSRLYRVVNKPISLFDLTSNQMKWSRFNLGSSMPCWFLGRQERCLGNIQVCDTAVFMSNDFIPSTCQLGFSWPPTGNHDEHEWETNTAGIFSPRGSCELATRCMIERYSVKFATSGTQSTSFFSSDTWSLTFTSWIPTFPTFRPPWSP